ncbi:MAG: hypothetical protein ACE5HL_00365 [Terriglobia bacterium]
MQRKNQLTFSEAIERVLLDNGYIAPLSLVYREIGKYRPLTGKTPFKTIQERVQRDSRFRRIGLGVYALTKYLDRLPKAPRPRKLEQQRNYKHTRVQGMLVEIGNHEGFLTYAPDRSKVFDGKTLGRLVTLQKIPLFTFAHIVQASRYIDVTWFNTRQFPVTAFEIEDSTNFRSALTKFSELVDFQTKFFVVAPAERRPQFDREASRGAFRQVAGRCKFVDYEAVEEYYQSRLNYTRALELFV